ncbi:MAG: MBG domain-containing protein [Verrucomicrobiia bacterium]
MTSFRSIWRATQEFAPGSQLVHVRAKIKALTMKYFPLSSASIYLVVVFVLAQIAPFSPAVADAPPVSPSGIEPSPAIVSDAADYAPLSTATFFGSGFSSGESVRLQVDIIGPPALTVTDLDSWEVVADATGSLQTSWQVCDCDGATLLMTAVGQTSGLTAQMRFTDGTPSGTSSTPGSLYALGWNGYGQLGTGDNINRGTPSPVTGLPSGRKVVAIAGGDLHSLAQADDGTLWAWGHGGHGQLGNGTTWTSHVPLPVNALPEGRVASSISAGAYHSLVLASDGSLWTWGYGGDGVLGSGGAGNSSMPVAVTTLGPGRFAVQIAAGALHNLVLANDGSLWAWGRGSDGQLGYGGVGSAPTAVAVNMGPFGGRSITAIAAGGYHSLALASDGTLWAWGSAGYGQLGLGNTGNQPVPTLIPFFTGSRKAVAIAAGPFHSVALASDGTVWAWGRGDYGQLGNGSTANSATPVNVAIQPSAGTIVTIAAGGYFNYALASDGVVWSWGNNQQGELGRGGIGGWDPVPRPILQFPPTGRTVVGIAGGNYTHGFMLVSEPRANNPPVGVALSQSTVPEDAASGTIVGLLAAIDPDLGSGDTHTFTLVPGAGDTENSSFVILGNALKTAVIPDYETQSVHSIRVRATDSFGASVESVLLIQVQDLNEAPELVDPLPDLTGTYGQAVSSALPSGAFSDPDIGQTLSYAAAGLPPGVTLDGSTGDFSGAPTAAGSFTVTITATDNGNPSLQASGTFQWVIQAKTIQVTAGPQTKVYGQSDPALTYTADPLVGSDSFFGTLSRAPGEDVGSYAIGQGTLSAGSNYTINFTGADFAITPKAIQVTANPQTKVYGEADPALSYTADPLVGSDSFSGALSRAPGEDVGSYAIGQGTLSAGSNYTISFTGADLAITSKAIQVTANPQTKVYGEADPALTYTADALVGSDSFSGALSRDPGEDVGSYAIGQGTLSAGSNYTISFTGANLAITSKAIQVTANPQTKVYGEADPALTYTADPLVGSDSFSGALSRAPGEDVGSYVIGQGTLAAGPNYTLEFTGSELSITPASLEVTIHTPSSGYLTPVNTEVVFEGEFTLTGVRGQYDAHWTFESATLAEYDESATITGSTAIADSFSFSTPGVYSVELTVADASHPTPITSTADTVQGDLPAYIVVFDPTGGFVTGGGWIQSPPGAYHPDIEHLAGVTGKASFGFQSKYAKGANVPTGNTEFQFRAGDLNFKSTEYEWLVIAGARAQFKGSGTINGQAGYGFILTAVDGQQTGGGGADRFRIKIWDTEASDAVIYDNQAGSGENAELGDHTVLGGGSIVIHQPPQGKK